MVVLGLGSRPARNSLYNVHTFILIRFAASPIVNSPAIRRKSSRVNLVCFHKSSPLYNSCRPPVFNNELHRLFVRTAYKGLGADFSEHKPNNRCKHTDSPTRFVPAAQPTTSCVFVAGYRLSTHILIAVIRPSLIKFWSRVFDRKVVIVLLNPLKVPWSPGHTPQPCRHLNWL